MDTLALEKRDDHALFFISSSHLSTTLEEQMNVEKKTLRSDIPGHQTYLHTTNGFAGAAGSGEELRRMVIGRDIVLEGKVSACDHLVIEGTVESDGFSCRRLDIYEHGLFNGTASVCDAVISGKFEGRLSVSGRLTVKSTGRISGDIEYGKLDVETGAVIEGRMAAVASKEASISKEKPAAEKRAVAESVANNVEPLFDDSDDENIRGRRRVYRRVSGQ